MSVATNFATPIVDSWHVLYTNGLLTVGSDFYSGGHPQPPGSFAMAMWHWRQLGFETNVGSLTFDFSNGTATTNHFTASGITISGLTLTATVRATRMAPSFDVPDGGSRTNDVRNAITEFPALGAFFNWPVSVLNLPAGNWVGSFDGVPVFTNTAAGWATGLNMFTNYCGPFWAQRIAVLDKIRDGYGVDHYTLVATHTAGENGVLNTQDLINYQSLGNQQYDTFGKRGSDYVGAMASCVTNGLYSYDTAKFNAAQQTNHTFTLVHLQSANVTTATGGTVHWGQ